MWFYVQRTGRLQFDGAAVTFGYSGKGAGKNNPDMQHVKNVGPIPRGVYTIGKPYDSKLRGPFCLPLTPHPSNEMHGRSAFLVHGDSLKEPGEASHGCIIATRAARRKMHDSGDDLLRVVADEFEITGN